MKVFVIAICLFVTAPPALARSFYFNWVQRGGGTAVTALTGTTNRFQTSYPGATVRVDQCGTSTLAAIYSNSSGTVKANPFSASSTGYYDFWTDLSCVALTFSGSGFSTFSIGNVQIAATPTDLGFVNVKSAPYLAAGDGVSDDGPEIQSALATVCLTGQTLYFPSAVYLTAQELSIPNTCGHSITIRGEGVVYGGAQNIGSTIRASSTIRSVLVVKYPHSQIENIRFDGAYLADYALLASGAASEGSAFSRIKEVHAYRAKKDGFSWAGQSAVSDNWLIDTPWAYNNGTIYASSGIRGQYQVVGVDSSYRTQLLAGTVSTTSGSPIVAGSGTAFLSIGLRGGDFIRVGSTISTADYMQVLSVDSDTQITCFGLSYATTTIAGAQYAAFIGDGLHFTGNAGINGIMRIKGGLVRANAASGIATFSQYGHIIEDMQLENSGLWGITIGFADANIPLNYSTTLIHNYFEGNIVASHWFGHARALTIFPFTTGDPVGIKLPPGLSHREFNATNVTGFAALSSLWLDGLDVNVVGNLAHNFARYTYFVITLENNGAGLRHSIACDINTGDFPRGAGRIRGAAQSPATTPSLSSVVGFTSGAGLIGGNTILLDTINDQAGGLGDGRQEIEADISLVRNSSGTTIFPEISFQSDNVNGVTIYRPALKFRDTSDALFTLSTGTIAVGKGIAVRIRVALR